MRKRYILPVLAAALSAALPGGCRHKETLYPFSATGEVRIIYDWHNDPSAFPAGMTVWIYPENGRAYQSDLPGREGGVVRMAEGSHDIITCNSDPEVARFANTGAFSSHFALTRDADLFESLNGVGSGANAPRARGTADERVTASPDPLWGTRVTGLAVAAGDTTLLVMEPAPLTCHYTVEIHDVSNLVDAEAMCASVTGLSPSVRLGDGELSDEPVTVPFGVTADRKRGMIRGEFLTFGHHPANGSPHRLILYVWMKDGRRLCYGTDGSRFDVTGQIDTAPDPRRVSITVEGLDLPAGFEEGTFQPGTSDWTEINTDITI